MLAWTKQINTEGNEESRIIIRWSQFTISKSKSSRLSYILEETKLFEIERCKPKRGIGICSISFIQLQLMWINLVDHSFKIKMSMLRIFAGRKFRS